MTFFYIFIITNTASAQKIYETTWKKESTILGSSAGLLLGSYIIDKNKTDLSIQEINSLMTDDINRFDRDAINNFSPSAANASDLFKNSLIVIPFSLFLSKQARENYVPILLMYAEVTAFNSGLTNITKAMTGRFRPFVYNPNVDDELKLSGTARRSFFSGHVSHVASLSFFTASVFSDLYPDSKFKYLVWGSAIAAPAATAYLRYKAGRHFSTDVIVGYGVGALVGYFIPKLHRNGVMSEISIVSANNGIGLVYQF